MSRRPLAALASVVLAVLGFVFLLPDCASACTCALEGGSQKEIVEGALSDSEAVFSGEVVAVEQGTATASGPGNDTVTLRASEVWKGPEQEALEVRTPSQGMACGYRFEEGREYLVYAYTGKRGLETNICTETKPLAKAGADLALLGGRREADGRRGPLGHLGGRFGAVAMVGLAGLALAASVLLVVRLVRAG